VYTNQLSTTVKLYTNWATTASISVNSAPTESYSKSVWKNTLSLIMKWWTVVSDRKKRVLFSIRNVSPNIQLPFSFTHYHSTSPVHDELTRYLPQHIHLRLQHVSHMQWGRSLSVSPSSAQVAPQHVRPHLQGALQLDGPQPVSLRPLQPCGPVLPPPGWWHDGPGRFHARPSLLFQWTESLLVHIHGKLL